MSITVYGTYCNPTPQFGLSFYCQGSTSACNVFRNFASVSCLSQSSQLYCTNQQTCGGANITNDIYIQFPSTGALTATDYDTVTRANYQFNRTISVAAYQAADTAQDGLTSRAVSSQTLSQKVLSTFQNIYHGNPKNPTKLLVNSLASTLFGLKVHGSAKSAAALQVEIGDALLAAMASGTNQMVNELEQCKEINATADGMSVVNKQFITNITREIPQPSLATWLLTNFVGHIIANSAVAEEIDIIQALDQSALASGCAAHTTSHVSSSKASSTSHATSKSSSLSAAKSSSTSFKSSTANTVKSSSTSKTLKTSVPLKSSTTTSHQSSKKSSTIKASSTSVTASSFTTHVCPSATPTGDVVYKSNHTQNQALGGSFSVYNGSLTHLQNVLLAPVNASSALYSFPNANTIALTLPDGESLIYTANELAITYLEPGCGKGIKFYNVKAAESSKRAVNQDEHFAKRDGSDVTVVMTVTDQCGNPVTSGYQLQLDCAEVVYPQTNAAAGPVVEPSTPEPFSNTGGGTYTAMCDLTDIQSANKPYDACVSEDRKGMDDFCGKDLSNVKKAKGYVEQFIKEAKKYAELVRYVKVLTTVLRKTNPALTFWDRMCDDRYGLENPYVQAQFDAEDCGYPAALSMALEGLDSSGTPFTSSLGIYDATPTTVYLSTTTHEASATACCNKATATPTAPDYVYVSDNCTSYSAGLGKSVFCCSGACLDGTSIGQPGQCQYWLDLCGDAEGGPPSCSANQVLSYGDPPTVDSGDGCCGACCCECQFQRNNWSYNCCDCPKGYQAVDRGQCDGTSNQCVGCADPTLTLVQSANGTYSCECTN